MPTPKSTSNDPIGDLVAANITALTAFVRLRMGPLIRAHESCDDIVQSVCREALEHADRFRFDGEGRFRQWLFTTAMRKLVDRKRYYMAEKRRADRNVRADATSAQRDLEIAACYQSAFTSPSHAAMKREEMERLERAFDALAEPDREVISLSRLAGFSNDAIARRLGISTGAVRVRISRALVRLAAVMNSSSRRT